VIVTLTPWQVFSELDGLTLFLAPLLPAPRDCGKIGRDQGPAQLDDHVLDGRLRLGPVQDHAKR